MEQQTPEQNQITVAESPKKGWVKTLAIVGVIALLAVGFWGSIQIIRSVPSAWNTITTGVYSIVSFFDRDDSGIEVVEAPTEETPVETPAPEAPTPAPTPAPSAPRPLTPGMPQTYTVGIPGGFVNDPNGYTDLKVDIIAVGEITNKSKNTLESKSSIDEDDTAGIRFVVENIGTKESGEFRMEVRMPTRSRSTWRSPEQDSIMPGQRVEYTLAFDELRDGDNREIEVTVDSENDTNDINRSNNTDEITIDITD